MEERIAELKKKLTGNLYEDIEVQQEIYELKKIIASEKGLLDEELEDFLLDDGCLYCGS
jgi:hypothetical protein